MKRDHKEISGGAAVCYGSSSGGSSINKSKLWEEDQDAGDVDELLAVLGYKVKSSDMADVAQKLEQLEMVMGTAQEDGISHLLDFVHYNPSDPSTWVQSMLTGLENSFDLTVILDVTAYPQPRKIKTLIESTGNDSSFSGGLTQTESSTRLLVLVDSQETKIRLVHALMACAKAFQELNLKLVDALVKTIKPKILTLVEEEVNHNSPIFVDRITEALYYYSSLFDSLEGSRVTQPSQDVVMSKMYLGNRSLTWFLVNGLIELNDMRRWLNGGLGWK